MCRFMFTLFVIILGTVTSYASIPRIAQELRLFGAYEDTIPHQELDEYIIAKVCSLKAIETVEKFQVKTGVSVVFSFEELPGLKLYLFSGAVFLQDDYYCVLFNANDSTVYPFDTGGPRFSRVISSYLPKIIEENKILDLINFYINTLSGNVPFYIVSDVEDYETLWEEEFEYAAKLYPPAVDSIKKAAEEDIDEVKKLIHERLLYDNDGYYIIRVTTWEKARGNLESWEFRVSESVFEVKSRVTYFLGKGPNLMQH